MIYKFKKIRRKAEHYLHIIQKLYMHKYKNVYMYNVIPKTKGGDILANLRQLGSFFNVSTFSTFFQHFINGQF